jgi:hypothetical protein
MNSLAGETPDAIGWQSNHSILIECKTSRSDFLADKNKFFRRYPPAGMGLERYYLTSQGLLSPNEMPPGWGLLEVRGRRIIVVSPAADKPMRGELGITKEIRLLVSALRRTQLRLDLDLSEFLRILPDNRPAYRAHAIATTENRPGDKDPC